MKYFLAAIEWLWSNLDKIESVFTIAAILAGLWWFYKRRERIPRANIEHQVKFIDLDNNTTYVGVHVVVRNTGNVLLRPGLGKEIPSVVVIEELKPYLAYHAESQELTPEYAMDFLGSRTFPPLVGIEPGQSQPVLFEFIIQNTTKAIKVYSHLVNGYNDDMSWDTTTTHEVKYDQE